MVTVSQPRRQPRQPLLSAAQLVTMGQLGTHVNTLGMDWLHPTAADRASVRAQAEGVRAYHVTGNEWVVPSASKPGQAHKVMVWGARVACSCECGRAHGSCKHQAAVRIELAKLAPVVEAKPAPTATAKITSIAPVRSIADLYSELVGD